MMSGRPTADGSARGRMRHKLSQRPVEPVRAPAADRHVAGREVKDISDVLTLRYSARMLPSRLLRDPLPDPLPSPGSGRFRWLRDLRASVAANMTAPPLSAEELVDRRVRRGAVQALVREAYDATVAEQDDAHRKPAEFAEAWRAHLATLLEQGSIELPGWSVITSADLDISFVWRLFEAASYARQRAIEHAKPTRSKRAQLASTKAQIFDFAIVSDGETLGEVQYGICPPCAAGLLYKISFDPDFQFCGLGRLALDQLETRHPSLTWYTTGQFKDAHGFYDRYRQHNDSPWTDRQHPCPHFD